MKKNVTALHKPFNGVRCASPQLEGSPEEGLQDDDGCM